MIHKNIKKLKISCFEVLDVLFQGEAFRLQQRTSSPSKQKKTGCGLRPYRDVYEDPYISGTDLNIRIPTKLSQIHNTGLRNATPDTEQDPELDPNPDTDL